MSKGGNEVVNNKYGDEDLIERLIEEDGHKLERSPTARRKQRTEWLNKKSSQGMKSNWDRFNFYRQSNQFDDFHCPHCKAKGDLL